MLARGILCRFAATDVPKTSTHDLPQLARLFQRSLLARNATSIPASAAISRAYNAVLSGNRRSYATATARATKPTPKVKRDVKKAAAKKPAAKKTAAKKSAAKKKPKRKTTTRKPKPKKKVAAKRTKKALTDAEKVKKTLREYKAKALKEPVGRGHISSWAVMMAEATSGVTSPTDRRQAVIDAAVRFKALTPAEKEHYNHLANERNAARRAEYDAWIKSHTPEEIRQANAARTYLRRKLKAMGKSLAHTQKLVDDRQVKRPLTGYIRFANERRASGDFKGIAIGETAKLAGEEWKSLTAAEKKKYDDAAAADKAAYRKEFANTYGRAPNAAAA